jgi:DNA-directed RNA polymerase
MPTPAQIEAQVKLERDAIACGLKKLRDNTEKLERKEYASATVYGVASIDTMLPLVIEEIERTADDRLRHRQAGQYFKEIIAYLSDLESIAAAAIACKVIFDRVFSYDDKSSYLAKVAESVGQAVENECQMRHYERVAPGLLHSIQENYYHRSIGTQQKLVVVRTLMNRCDIEKWSNWGSVNRVKIGNWLIGCVCRATGWFTTTKITVGSKTPTVVTPTPEFLKIKDQVVANSELFSPEAWPMLIEPNDWTPDRSGGYLLNEVMRGHDLVRKINHHPIQGENIYTFLNKIQKVGLRINPDIMEVAEYLYEKGRTVGKFIPVWKEDAPPVKPVDIETNKEARKAYCREAAEWHNRQNDNAEKSVRTRKVMEMARRFKDAPAFYLPWSLDYRGRAYPIPAFLTPQETDFGKSLLLFAEPSFITEEAELWLAFQVATTYGLDKATMEERQAWVKENFTLISKVAIDPIDSLPEWESADEPWQFLAACIEYYRCCIDCSQQFTSLPVATDATCSGLQILAGLARDKSTARLVNVLPGEKPQDAYKAVAELAKPNCPEELQSFIDRKVAKRLVMTIPYNAKFKSNWEYVKDALIEEHGLDPTKEQVTEVTHALREAVFTIFPGPTKVMDWINEEVVNAVKRGQETIKWITPSGFTATQRFMKLETKQLDLQLLGRVRVNIAIGEKDEVDLNHHKNATSPNLIHSLDASLLHLSVLRFDAPIALIHDSVLCRATDMSTLSSIVRETYMHLFAEHDYLRDFAAQIGAETEPPIIGDLEPESVIESTYFFC